MTLINLTSADIDAARERHQEAVWEDYTTKPPTLKRTGECVADDQPWPCDAARFRDALDRSEAEWERAAEAVESAAAERLDAAHALADELAERLPERLHDLYAAALCVSDLPMHDWAECDHKPRWQRDASAALAKWEASPGT